ncbi:uncharacterized protein LACBIDRAFT_333842 [Laccaria bicolor S238N-H82]|uniref:Predicted protein n=1 Tax=Laccaria bicolor (strain S238N-H82 / ATCC MYA-4686) TaxID=486041 RepID=B0DX93_LACBS|nr:uncharacterized protein LACBIDRAFT_333842 [Laccaria bicolor S238N-H82]EDR00752.1 predicted protein [Laccaria bicolor S238N-H82]|eukprot:XP_001888544.1 predicted protein [Laccaria bicolor S238N-H82]
MTDVVVVCVVVAVGDVAVSRGWEQPRTRPPLLSTPMRATQDRPPQHRRVLMTIAEEREGNQVTEEVPKQEESQIDETHDDMLREVYQVMQKRQRAPPPGGYMFPRNDHVTTKMGKLPPSPCRACGSENHWDKECPDGEIYNARMASEHRNGHSNETVEDEGDKCYQSAFSILLSQRLATSQFDLSRVKSDFEQAVHHEEINALSVEDRVDERKSVERQRVTVQEIDDESWLEARSKPKASTYLLYNTNEETEDERPDRTKDPPPSARNSESLHENATANGPDQAPTLSDDKIRSATAAAALASESKEQTLPRNDSPDDVESPSDFQLPPPPKDLKPVRLAKKRFYPVGESSVGVSVLSVKGWVGNMSNPITDLRLDSCADVTLISAEYYDSLKASPPIQQGMCMRLWQLTDKDSRLRGFVRIPILMVTDDGITIKSEAEAYVVPGMTVPILLGEDYQLTYEVGVTRNVEEGPQVHFGKSEYSVTAKQVERTKDFDRMRQSAHSIGRFIRN